MPYGFKRLRTGTLMRASKRARFVVRRAPGRASRLAQRFAQSQTQTLTRRSRSAQSGTVTFQRDGVTRYVKSRMPRAMRRRWRSFVRRVEHVNLQAGPTRTFTRASTDFETWNANEQGYFGYMCGGMTVTGNNELREVFTDAHGTGVGTTLNQRKLFIKSLVMDVQVRNSTEGGTPIVLDVYTLRCRKGYESASSPSVQYGNLWADLLASGGGTTSSVSPAVTVFQNPGFLQYWSVIKKQELVIGGGNLATFQIRLPTNKMIHGKDFEREPQALPGYTYCLFFMPRGAPIDGGLSTTELASGEVNVGMQWTVCYQVVPSALTQNSTRQV